MTRLVALVASAIAATALAGCTTTTQASGPTDTSRPGGPAGNFVPDPTYRVSSDLLALGAAGREIAASCTKGICIWDATSGSLTRTIPGPSLLGASPDGATFATLAPTPGPVRLGDSYPVRIRLFTAATGSTIHEVDGHRSTAVTDVPLGRGSAVAFSPNGSLVATSGDDATVRVWAVADGSLKRQLATGGTTRSLAWSPDSTRLATAGSTVPLVVWDIEQGTPIKPAPASGTEALPARGIAWSPEGQRLAVTSAGPGGSVRILDATTQAVVATHPRPGVGSGVAFQPGGSLVAFSSPDSRTVVLWDPATSTSRELAGHTKAPGAVAFSPDGASLFSVSTDDGIWRWDVAAGQRSTQFELPPKFGQSS